MFEKFKFTVVEDKVPDREEIMNRLARAKFLPENQIGPPPTTYEDALELISTNAHELDVVFLDLNIPRNHKDSRPEKGHGHRLLEIIHDDLNKKSGVHVRVVIVSGEDLLDGMSDKVLLRTYKGTLVSIAQKAVLDETLKASLKRLRRDPLLARIRAADLNVLGEYECIFDSTQPIRERLEASRRLAICLVRNEADHYEGRFGATDSHADNLNGLIKDFIEIRFDPENPEKPNLRRVKASQINTPGGWGAFLWRGAMVQHLYAINSYRNLYAHINAQPYAHPSDDGQEWKIPVESLREVDSGAAAGQIMEAIVKDLLLWYLPWHEQVYKPWFEEHFSDKS